MFNWAFLLIYGWLYKCYAYIITIYDACMSTYGYPLSQSSTIYNDQSGKSAIFLYTNSLMIHLLLKQKII